MVARAHRRYGAERQRTEDYRNEYERDLNRISGFSYFFHRLGYKTQILSPDLTADVIHTRQMHAHKVKDTAFAIAKQLMHNDTNRDIVERLGGLDPVAASAGGAAHDLGHPPFGHLGEAALNQFSKDLGLGPFEGNAQTYRIISKLEVQSGTPRGMDLTALTRAAVLKYPTPPPVVLEGPDHGGGIPVGDVMRSERAKFGYFASEAADAAEALSLRAPLLADNGLPTLEAQVMDLADDVSFALHDLEDFYRLGAIAYSDLANDRFFEDEEGVAAAIRKEVRTFDRAHWDAARYAVSRHLRERAQSIVEARYGDLLDQDRTLREWTSYYIRRWLDGIKVDSRGRVLLASELHHEVLLLKQVTWRAVIARPSLRISQEGQSACIRELCDILMGLVQEDPDTAPKRLIEFRRVAIEDPDTVDLRATELLANARAVVDYVAWLTERQARELYRALTGKDVATARVDWLR